MRLRDAPARRPAGDHPARHQSRSLRSRRVRADRVIRLAAELRMPDGRHRRDLRRARRAAADDPDRGDQAARAATTCSACCWDRAAPRRRSRKSSTRHRAGRAARPRAARPLCRGHAGGLHAGRCRRGDRRAAAGFQPRADRGAGDGPAGGRRRRRRRRRGRAARHYRLAGPKAMRHRWPRRSTARFP